MLLKNLLLICLFARLSIPHLSAYFSLNILLFRFACSWLSVEFLFTFLVLVFVSFFLSIQMHGKCVDQQHLWTIYPYNHIQCTHIESGRLFVWGENQYGQLSAGSKEVIAKPSCVKEIKNLGYKVRNIAFGEAFSVILTGRNIQIHFTTKKERKKKPQLNQ